MELNQAEIDRFWKKVDKKCKEQCWEWTGGKFQMGYGMVCLRRGCRKTFLAHRIAWIIHNKKQIPEKMMVCHTCDNRICVNPFHLYVGTGKDNNTDTIKRNRGNRKIGGQCSWAKLTENSVLAILASTERQYILAKRYGVHQSQISEIKSGKQWRHLSQKAV